jgi:hypothetical protein
MPFVLLNEPFCNTGYQLVYKTSVFVKNRVEKNKDTFAYLAFISLKILIVLDFEQTPTPIIANISGNVLLYTPFFILVSGRCDQASHG